MEKLKYSYYPGCSLESTSKEYDLSIREVASRLDIELMVTSLALPARNLALAEKEGRDIAVGCAACFLRFKQTNYTLRKNDSLRSEIEKIIGMPYKGNVEVRHFVDIFVRQVGLAEIQRKVTVPLDGLKLAAYYGCYLVRPPEVTEFDDPENPRLIDDLVKATGAETVEWTHKTECCGGNLLLSRSDIVMKLTGDICQAAADAGAVAIVTACPLCQANLDTRQPSPKSMPVIHFTELLGVDSKTTRTWWKRHIVNPERVIKTANPV